jgi:hypothetical protein
MGADRSSHPLAPGAPGAEGQNEAGSIARRQPTRLMRPLGVEPRTSRLMKPARRTRMPV